MCNVNSNTVSVSTHPSDEPLLSGTTVMKSPLQTQIYILIYWQIFILWGFIKVQLQLCYQQRVVSFDPNSYRTTSSFTNGHDELFGLFAQTLLIAETTVVAIEQVIVFIYLFRSWHQSGWCHIFSRRNEEDSRLYGQDSASTLMCLVWLNCVTLREPLCLKDSLIVYMHIRTRLVIRAKRGLCQSNGPNLELCSECMSVNRSAATILVRFTSKFAYTFNVSGRVR